jgi:hypothetical protein
MTPREEYLVMLFPAVSYVLKAEKILKEEKIPHKLIPIPRYIDSDCGICLRFHPEMKEKIAAALDGKVEFDGIRDL